MMYKLQSNSPQLKSSYYTLSQKAQALPVHYGL